MKHEEYCFYPDHMPEWGIDSITVAEDPDGDLYFQFRPICDALQMQRSGQNAFIQSDSRIRKGVRTIKAPTDGGRQDTLFIRKRETAIWLASIDPEKVNGVAKGRLNEFQEGLWRLAERTVFRRHMVAHAGAEDIDTRTLPGHCPYCGMPLEPDPASIVFVRAKEQG